MTTTLIARVQQSGSKVGLAMSDAARIERALDYLAANVDSQPSLVEIASQVNLSEYHFQRLFTRRVGISPKKFLQYLTLDAAKQRLAASASVLDAAYDAGLSGPGRLHDLFVTVEAMTPGEFKKRGAGLVIRYGFHPCLLFGECLIMETDRGICGFAFVTTGGRQAAYDDLAARWSRATFIADHAGTMNSTRRIFARYDEDVDPNAQPLRLLLCGTQFQIKVWEALLTIPMGALTTYGDLAQRIGYKKGAARAVGTANGANLISYLIPCHRVIRRSGTIGGYHWGPGRKLALIGWEAAQLENLHV
jgi:AraC family transcriptional regulator of adaptative response/methylated-DNA-[protein]-cysteine methyltransferase